MVMTKNLTKALVLVAVLVLPSVGHAGFLSKLNVFRYFSSKNRVHTLIITGNYGKSRLLAELVQYKTGQPILLVSRDATGEDALYFLPKGEDAMALGKDRFVEFVDFVQPKRVLFVGDNSYISTSYVDALRDRFAVLVVNSEDWVQNANALAEIMKYKKLPKQYSDYLIQLEASSSGRAVSSGVTAESAIVEPAVYPLAAPTVAPGQ